MKLLHVLLVLLLLLVPVTLAHVLDLALQTKLHLLGNSKWVITLLDRKDCRNALLWSKTILTTGNVGGPGVDPPLRKINALFLRSLALSVPIYRHLQSNGANWRSSKHLTKKKLCNGLLYRKIR